MWALTSTHRRGRFRSFVYLLRAHFIGSVQHLKRALCSAVAVLLSLMSSSRGRRGALQPSTRLAFAIANDIIQRAGLHCIAGSQFFRGEAPKAMGLSIPCVSWYVTAACFRRCRKVGRVARARTGCNRQRKLGTGSASLSVFANGGASARALRGGDHARDHATNAGSRSRRSNETQGPLLVSSRLVRAQVRPK